MNLIIDIGNTFSKLAVFKEDELIHSLRTDAISKQIILDFLHPIEEKVRHVVLANVKDYPQELENFFEDCFHTFLKLDHTTAVPITIAYRTPETLGVDRIPAVVEAMAKHPGRNVLVIDAGTCITYDFIDENSRYSGGAISPGLHMRFQAMHTFTGHLPLIERKFSSTVEWIGDSTENAMLSGVINGLQAELSGTIEHYRTKYKNLQVLLTGGDVKVFENVVKKPIFADANLVLFGLHKILSYNLDK